MKVFWGNETFTILIEIELHVGADDAFDRFKGKYSHTLLKSE